MSGSGYTSRSIYMGACEGDGALGSPGGRECTAVETSAEAVPEGAETRAISGTLPLVGVGALVDGEIWAGELRGERESTAIGGKLAGVGVPTEELPWTNGELASNVCA
jgi:hypothetical protein